MPRKAKSKQSSETISGGASWKSIRQKGQLRSSTTAARERRRGRYLKYGGIALAAIVFGGGLVFSIYFSSRQVRNLEILPVTPAISEVVFSSDRVLDLEWFHRNFEVRTDIPAGEFDVFALKTALESNGQIRRAAVSVVLPSTLKIRIEEEVPVLRGKVRDRSGVVRDILITGEGNVFAAQNYDKKRLLDLPGLIGVPIVQKEDGYAPIEGASRVADLLVKAEALAPESFSEWKYVSLDGFKGDPEAPGSIISVKSRFVDRIVFAPDAFDHQLIKLNEVVAVAREHRAQSVRQIDLSISNQAIVQFN